MKGKVEWLTVVVAAAPGLLLALVAVMEVVGILPAGATVMLGRQLLAGLGALLPSGGPFASSSNNLHLPQFPGLI